MHSLLEVNRTEGITGKENHFKQQQTNNKKNEIWKDKVNWILLKTQDKHLCQVKHISIQQATGWDEASHDNTLAWGSKLGTPACNRQSYGSTEGWNCSCDDMGGSQPYSSLEKNKWVSPTLKEIRVWYYCRVLLQYEKGCCTAQTEGILHFRPCKYSEWEQWLIEGHEVLLVSTEKQNLSCAYMQ